MTVWVDGAAILADAGVKSPSTSDTDWADACAAAVNAGLDKRLEGVETVWPTPLPAELTWVALRAGTESYKRREATFGITGYADLNGAAIRVARDYLEGYAPIIERYATRGLA